MTDLLKTLGALAAASGCGAGIAWAIFTKLGDRWLEERFAKRLETFKHEQTKEIEQLRHRITSLFSRISKIHEKEFEVLPEAWLKLHDAYGKVFHVGSALKRFLALHQMSEANFEEFVATCRLPEFRKQELLQLQAADRTEYYSRWIFWSDFAEAQSAMNAFHNYFVMNRIFMTDSLRQKFGEIDVLLNSVLSSLELDQQIPSPTLKTQLSADLAKIQFLLVPLEKAIQDRLRFEDA